MSCPLGDKKGRSADSGDLTRLHRETADLAAYITYTTLDDKTKLKEQISADSNFSLTRGGLTLIANSTVGFTRNPVTGAIMYPPYSGQTAVSSTSTNPPKWLAGGDGSYQLAYSYDGITWKGVDVSSIFSLVLGLAWNGSMWVAGGQVGTNTLAYSYDGVNWRPSENGTSVINTYAFCVAWNGSMWVAGGHGGNRLAYSYDGITWQATANGSSIFTDTVLAIKWNGTMWVAGGNGGNTLAYSYDGITWYPSSNGNSIITGYVYAVAWNGTRWVAGGAGTTNSLAFSSDGITWTASPDGNNVVNLVFAIAYQIVLG